MTKFLKDLKPSTITISTLWWHSTPGPNPIHSSIHRAQAYPALITYLDPALEPILKKTYGILVYKTTCS